jgi:thymidylate kinase
MSSGLLVSIDGPGGVGKSTLTSQLAAQLIHRGVPALFGVFEDADGWWVERRCEC